MELLSRAFVSSVPYVTGHAQKKVADVEELQSSGGNTGVSGSTARLWS